MKSLANLCRSSIAALKPLQAALSISPEKSKTEVEVLQQEYLIEVLLSAIKHKKRNSGADVKCKPGFHVLVCGHWIRNQGEGLPILSTNLACQTPTRIGSSKPVRKEGRFRNSSGNSEASSDLEYRETEDSLDPAVIVCPMCWLQECLIRFYYFAQDSQLAVGTTVFSTKEEVTNSSSILDFPRIVEVSRRLNGKIYAWSGPQVILDWTLKEYAAEMMGIIGRLINATEPTPMNIPLMPCVLQVIKGGKDLIKEVKLIPVDKKRSEKSVRWNDNTIVHHAIEY